jgi:hypothetical protein
MPSDQHQHRECCARVPTEIHGMRPYAYSNPPNQRTINMKYELNRTVTHEDICSAIQDLAEDGLIVDSGRKKWSPQTGQYEILWTLSPAARDNATKSITSPSPQWRK